MSVNDLLVAISSTRFAGAIGGNSLTTGWIFPVIETLHVLALATVFGTIAMVDLRLLGVSGREIPASRLSAEVLPWTWTAFVAAALSGTLMFIAKAPLYWYNPLFEAKFAAMFLAGVNMLVFHLGVYRRVLDWDTSRPPAAARIAGAVSICLWMVVIFMGRWTGFSID